MDAQNGTQIWTETFDRELTSAGILAVQDEITDRIVATVADPAGIVVRTLAAPAGRKAPEDLTPYEAVLRYFLFQQRISTEDHLITRAALERAVELDSGYADAWTSLSLIYQQEHMNNLNLQPNSLQRALVAAQRAVDLDPLLPGLSSHWPRSAISSKMSTHFMSMPSAPSNSTLATPIPWRWWVS